MKVSGRACRQIQEGSGWVATSGLVVTNAHVVAGEDETTVEDINGAEHDATVVAFDPVRDLAVLRVGNLDAHRASARIRCSVGDVGAVYGHPGGGPLRARRRRASARRSSPSAPTSTARARAGVRSSCWRPRSRRATRAARWSNEQGEVIGVAFAIDPGREGTSYAVTDDEVRAGARHGRLLGRRHRSLPRRLKPRRRAPDAHEGPAWGPSELRAQRRPVRSRRVTRLR